MAEHLVIYDGIKCIVDHYEGLAKSKHPANKSYERLVSAKKDKLTVAMLEVFAFVAKKK